MKLDKKYEFIHEDQIQTVIKNIRSHFEYYIIMHNIQSAVLGVSGGIDSTLVAALAKPVCERLHVPLIGRSLPCSSNKSDEKSRANDVGYFFCSDFKLTSLEDLFSDVDTFLFGKEKHNIASENPLKCKIMEGNIKARLRMIYLYNLAQQHNGFVLSTDNLTELLLGFWTLHGDVGDFGMIQNLWKSEVYLITEYLANNEYKDTPGEKPLRDAIECLATDGLGVSRSDLDQILPGWEDRHTTTKTGYREVDLTLFQTLAFPVKHGELVGNQVISRHVRTEFKRNNPYNINRETLIEADNEDN